MHTAIASKLSAPVKKAIEAFEAYQDKTDGYGARDTEANWHLHNVIRLAVQGKPMPEYINFELFHYWNEEEPAKMRRSRQINQAMTNKARSVYNAIIKGPMSNREALQSYAWRVSF